MCKIEIRVFFFFFLLKKKTEGVAADHMFTSQLCYESLSLLAKIC